MINVFVIHSGRDYKMVKEEIEPFLVSDVEKQSYMPNCNILTLESGVESNWKKDAAKKIKMSHAVIFVLGDDANTPSKADTMGWEVARAVKLNKLIMIYNPNNNPIPSYLMVTDYFTKQQRLVAPQMTLDDIKTRIEDYVNGNYPIFSNTYTNLDAEGRTARKNELIDQYKLFQKTSEDLIARRQTVSSFYLTVNSALTALMGVVLGLVDGNTKMIVTAFMCIAGIILDFSWINILDAYGTLNAAKLKVIRILEEQLPVTLYDAEWMIMSDKLNNKKYVSFTDSEKRIPKLFLLLYSVIITVIGVITIVTFINR